MSAFRATFVSHAHADNDLCDRYVAALRPRGIDIWYDRDNAQNGHLLGSEIQKEIQQRAAFVLLMTENALGSFWVDLEMQSYLGLMAQDRSRLLLPVRIGSCAVPPFLNAFFWIDAQAMPFEQAIEAIASALSDSTMPSAQPRALPATSSPVNAPAPQTPTDPVSDLLARFLPQLRDAFNAQDWPQVARLAAFIQRSVPAEKLPSEVYAMQGRALMAERDYAGAKTAWDTIRQRDSLDVTALRAATDARIALGEKAAALPLLDDALTLTTDRAQRLALLRIDASVLAEVARAESGASAQTHWTTLQRVVNEGLQLAGEQDADWLALKLEALMGLQHDQEALDLARTLTALPGATATLWMNRARLAWKLAGETPNDEIRGALDAASRLAPNDAALALDRQQLLVILKPDRFPPRLAEQGFVVRERNGVAFIVPPICSVPAGEFLMGSNKRRDKDAINDHEMPQHRVTLAAFSITRFPVTVAEYACFVAAARHREPQEWAGQLKKLDYPVVSVSWDDAIAYAAWLAQMNEQPWRLPTEAEWEKAARGTDGRLFPWGNTFDRSRANTVESRLRGATAVGSYPSGASPYGAEEMGGNVWEWTHSLYKPYPYKIRDGREAPDSDEDRVQRGGSWYAIDVGARAATRLSASPDRCKDYDGFRLLLEAPGSA